jgi:hypothetical protein
MVKWDLGEVAAEGVTFLPTWAFAGLEVAFFVVFFLWGLCFGCGWVVVGFVFVLWVCWLFLGAGWFYNMSRSKK